MYIYIKALSLAAMHCSALRDSFIASGRFANVQLRHGSRRMLSLISSYDVPGAEDNTQAQGVCTCAGGTKQKADSHRHNVI